MWITVKKLLEGTSLPREEKKMNVYYTLADRTGFRTVPDAEFSKELRARYNRVIYKDSSGCLEIRVSSKDVTWLLRMFLCNAVSDRLKEVQEGDFSND